MKPLKNRRAFLKGKAQQLGLTISIENYGKYSIYRFYQKDNLLFSAVGIKEACVWLNGYHSGTKHNPIIDFASSLLRTDILWA